MLATGIKNKIELNVTDKNTAKAVGSGTLEVYATPQMVNLMETCACFSVEPYMEPGKTDSRHQSQHIPRQRHTRRPQGMVRERTYRHRRPQAHLQRFRLR